MSAESLNSSLSVYADKLRQQQFLHFTAAPEEALKSSSFLIPGGQQSGFPAFKIDVTKSLPSYKERI